MSPRASNASISVVVCVKNGGKTLRACLESVKKNRPREIIVVDGNSTDDTREIARGFTKKIFSDEGRGLAHARNVGVAKSRGKYIAFVDADVVLPHARVLANMVSELEASGYAGIHAQVVAGRVTNYWEWSENEHLALMFNKPGARHRIGCITVIYPREVLAKTRFDERLKKAAEDQDLCHRLAQKGAVFGVSKEKILHFHRSDFSAFWKQKEGYGVGVAIFSKKHASLSAFLKPFLVFPYGSLKALAALKPGLIPYYFLISVAGVVGELKELLGIE